MSTEKKKKLTKQEIIAKLSELSEKELRTIVGGSSEEFAHCAQAWQYDSFCRGVLIPD